MEEVPGTKFNPCVVADCIIWFAVIVGVLFGAVAALKSWRDPAAWITAVVAAFWAAPVPIIPITWAFLALTPLAILLVVVVVPDLDTPAACIFLLRGVAFSIV